MVVYAGLKRWEQAEAWARKLNRARGKFSRQALKKMILTAKKWQALALASVRKYDATIQVLTEIVDEFARKNKRSVAAALYNIGVIYERTRRFPKAIVAYEAVVSRYKKERVAFQAMFALGILYEAQGRLGKAARAMMALQSMRGSGGGAERQQKADALRNAGLLYEVLGRTDRAVQAFDSYAARFKTMPNRALIAFRSAELLARNPDEPSRVKAASQFSELAKKFGKEGPFLALRARAASALTLHKTDSLKHARTASAGMRRVVAQWRKISSQQSPLAQRRHARTREYVAMCAFELADIAHRRFSRVKLAGLNGSRLTPRTYGRLTKELRRIATMYDSVIALGSVRQTAFAGLRTGELHAQLADGLLTTATGPTLRTTAARVHHDKAAELLRDAFSQALAKGVYAPEMVTAAQRLAKLDPGRFPLARFRLSPKPVDTVGSTSFVRWVRRGGKTVDFSRR